MQKIRDQINLNGIFNIVRIAHEVDFEAKNTIKIVKKRYVSGPKITA